MCRFFSHLRLMFGCVHVCSICSDHTLPDQGRDAYRAEEARREASQICTVLCTARLACPGFRVGKAVLRTVHH